MFCPITDGHFTGTPPSYGYDADRAEEQRRHHDILPYIDDSPSSSPHLSSKSRSSRDTLSSGSLESSKSVSMQNENNAPRPPPFKLVCFWFLQQRDPLPILAGDGLSHILNLEMGMC